MLRAIWVCLACCLTAVPLFAEPPKATQIVPEGAKLETLWSDGTFTEGAAIGPDGCIYFSDIGAGGVGRIMKFDPRTSATTVYSSNSGQSNGLLFDGANQLIACCGGEGGRRALCLIEPDGTPKELADRFDGKRFHSPNDLAIAANGDIYFTDPRYGNPGEPELDHSSVYRFRPSTREVTLATSEATKPNGVVLSPDGKRLYVAETNEENGRMTLNAFPVLADGALGERTILVDYEGKFGVDGMEVDEQGNIYCAVLYRPGIVVYSPEGEELGEILTPSMPTNCCFGSGEEASTLYITAGKNLHRIKLKIPGAPALRGEAP